MLAEPKNEVEPELRGLRASSGFWGVKSANGILTWAFSEACSLTMDIGTPGTGATSDAAGVDTSSTFGSEYPAAEAERAVVSVGDEAAPVKPVNRGFLLPEGDETGSLGLEL